MITAFVLLINPILCPFIKCASEPFGICLGSDLKIQVFPNARQICIAIKTIWVTEDVLKISNLYSHSKM
jgi:hypothetical protein